MEKWVLSIVGTVALGVLLDIIIPDGEMNKYIKGVFAIVVITVVVAPLPTFFLAIKNGHIIPPNYGDELEVDDAFVNNIHSSKISNIEHKIAEILINNDVNYNKIEISDDFEDNFIDKLYIEVGDELSRNKVIDIINNKVKLKFREVKIVATRSG